MTTDTVEITRNEAGRRPAVGIQRGDRASRRTTGAARAAPSLLEEAVRAPEQSGSFRRTMDPRRRRIEVGEYVASDDR